jgi:aryl-alcohol dehydrogenase-like predicted oxidoreductase
MTFGEDWGWGASQAESRKILEQYAEAGGNFVDTSCNYTEGTSERFVGELTSADRDHFVIATKYSLTERRDDPNFGGNHRKNLLRSLEGSLRRLRTDHVDLLWLHMWDGTTPVEEVARTMDDQVRLGKVLYWGFSDTPAWVVAETVAMASVRGWVPPVAIQAPYSILDRGVERELLPMAHAHGLAVTVWGMLEGGVLTGKYRKPEGPTRYRSASERELAAGDAVVALAGELGRTPAQVAIGWILAKRSLAQVIPILGARRLEQLEDQLGALDVPLSAEHVDRLDQMTEFRLGFPREFLESDHVHGLIFGETFDRIDRR